MDSARANVQNIKKNNENNMQNIECIIEYNIEYIIE